jgi:heat shock protein HtpX
MDGMIVLYGLVVIVLLALINFIITEKGLKATWAYMRMEYALKYILLSFLVTYQMKFTLILIIAPNLLFLAKFRICFVVSFIVVTLFTCNESIMCFWFGCRPTKYMTEKEKEQLYTPQLYELMGNFTSKYPINVKFYIDDSTSINAYTFGLSSIIVTKGCLNMLNEEEIAGVISHELGHLRYGHAITPLVVYSNPFCLIFIAVHKLCTLLFGKKTGSNKNLVISLVNLVLSFLLSFFTIITTLIKRIGEGIADRFTVEMGTTEYLINALYKISMTELRTDTPSLLERLQATHPNIYVRSAKLETEEDL